MRLCLGDSHFRVLQWCATAVFPTANGNIPTYIQVTNKKRPRFVNQSLLGRVPDRPERVHISLARDWLPASSRRLTLLIQPQFVAIPRRSQPPLEFLAQLPVAPLSRPDPGPRLRGLHETQKASDPR